MLGACRATPHHPKILRRGGSHITLLFTERSEITVHHTTSQSLENSIKERVKRLLNTDVSDITPLDDLDAQLGKPAQTPETPEEKPAISTETEVQIPETEVQKDE
jgi:hypothetical protein